jgi:hypothetical protein
LAGGKRPTERLPKDLFVREKFTRERTAARKLAAEYFERFPKDRYQTEVESWRELQSQNIEFTMKRQRSLSTTPIRKFVLKSSRLSCPPIIFVGPGS